MCLPFGHTGSHAQAHSLVEKGGGFFSEKFGPQHTFLTLAYGISIYANVLIVALGTLSNICIFMTSEAITI